MESWENVMLITVRFLVEGRAYSFEQQLCGIFIQILMFYVELALKYVSKKTAHALVFTIFVLL